MMASYKNSTKRVAALMLTGLLIAGCGGSSDGAAFALVHSDY